MPAPRARAPVQESVSSSVLGSDDWDMTDEEGEEESVLENDPITDPDEQETFKKRRDTPGEKWDETLSVSHVHQMP